MPKFELAPLPYAFEALEPHIDAQTMQIHHGKHHAAYVTNLNNALEKYPQFLEHSAEQLIQNLNEVPEDVRMVVRNNAGGHVNHTMFWNLMAAGASGAPTGEVATAIDSAFGGFDSFKEQFQKAAMGRFGSGWAWLIVDSGKLAITSTPNQDNPLMDGKRAILGVDVWEHAYYLKYQNRRADYLAAWWNVVNWEAVAALMAEAMR
jgi:Fe-Mn family superoxide dismutase